MTIESLPLPAALPPLPMARGPLAEPFALSIPARTYTGDFFFTRRIGGTLWFSLGDIAGKGIEAAVWMAMVQEELDHLISDAQRGLKPCSVVRRLDAMLREEMPPNRFATLVVGSLASDGTLNIANAGHPPLIVRRHSGSLETVGSNGPAAGILPNRCWGTSSLRLEAGDLAILYTDGAIEVNDAGGEELGVAGVLRIAGEAPASLGARAAAEHLLAGIRAWGDGSLADDLTLLVLPSPLGA